jgi:very-short-patch-repair endonuclease
MTRSIQHDRAALAATLARQYQVISRSQVLAHGMTSSALRQRLRPGGPWQRLLPGVFLAVTGTPTTEQCSVAALLYAGTGGLLTGAAAVGLWGVQAPRNSMIDVLIPAARQRRSAAFARIQLTARMPDQVFTVGPVRLVPLVRAVADAARGMTALADVRAVVAAAVQLGKCTPEQLAAELDAGPVQGSALLRTAVSDVCDGTRSSPEADLKHLLRRAKIAEPVFNPKPYAGDVFVASPDAWWPDAGIAGEVDSRANHLSPHDHERTLARDARMAAHGITVLHFTPRQIRTRPGTVIATIRAALAAADSRPRLPIRTITTSSHRPRRSAERAETPVP